MLKQEITYKDFNGVERTEELYFNLTEAELVDIQNSSERGIQEDLKEAIASKDLRKMLEFIKMLVIRSYGEKSADGRHFRKNDQIREDFVNSAYYSDLLLHLFEDEGTRAEKFITGLMPADLVARAAAKTRGESPANVKPDARELNARHIAERNIPVATVESNYRESEPIGSSSTTPQFVAPQYQEQVAQVREEGATAEVRPQSAPSAQLPATLPEQHKPFRVKETPLDEVADPDRAAFEEWKAQQGKHAE